MLSFRRTLPWLTLAALSLSARAQSADATAPAVAVPDQPAPAGGASPQPAPAQPAAKPLPRFDILEFLVDGNSVLPVEDIERAVYPSLGYQHTLDDVETARAALEAVFQAKGYLTVSVIIPEQKVENGVVHLRAVEGRVGRLRVTGSRYFDLGYIREHAPSVAEGTVPSFPQVQKELGELNRSPDLRIAPILRVGKAPGTVDVDLAVEDKAPLHGDIELNNRYNAYTAPLRLTGSLHYDNLWQREHSLGLTWNVAPQHASNADIFSATYTLPVQDDRSLSLYAVHSSSFVVPGAIETVGKGNIFGARYVIPLSGSKTLFHSLTLGIDHKNLTEADRPRNGGALTETPITYVPLLVQYGGFATDAGGTTQFALTGNLSAGAVFGNKDADFENKRSGASATYFALRADLSRTQQLPKGWALFGHAVGQVSDSPLISSEQFVAGGAESVRGYLEAEALGDIGLQGTVEVRTPNLFAESTGIVPQGYALVFVDAANLKVREALSAQTPNFSLASEGLGLRLGSRSGLRLSLDLAHVLRTSVFTHEGATRLEFKLGQDF